MILTLQLQTGVPTVQKTLRIISLIVLILLPTFLFAQQESTSTYREYGMGSQIFTFRAGPFIPAFMYRPSIEDGDALLSFSDTRMNVGGYGSIRYQGFLTSTLALGGELGYIFAYDKGEELFTSVPIQAKLTYIPLQGRFELPLSVGLGFAYNSLEGASVGSLFVSAEVGFSWFYTDNWGITLSGGLHLIPELYTKNHPNFHDSTLLGTMPITLSLSYRNN